MRIDIFVNWIDGNSRAKRSVRLDPSASKKFENILDAHIERELDGDRSDEAYSIKLTEQRRRDSQARAEVIKNLNQLRVSPEIVQGQPPAKTPPSLTELLERPRQSFDKFFESLTADMGALAAAHGELDREQVSALLGPVQ